MQRELFIFVVLTCSILRTSNGTDYDNEDNNELLCKTEEVKSNTSSHAEQYFDPNYGWQITPVYDTLYTFVECTDETFVEGIPLQISGNRQKINYILFKRSTLLTVPVGVFSEFTNLTELYLNESAVSSIHPGAFTGLTQLKQLYLQDNNITEIYKGIFNSLPSLEILNLANNNINDVEEKSFHGLIALQQLYLGNNKLNNLPFDVFQGLNMIEVIDLFNNNLTIIPSCRLVRLRKLDVSSNHLSAVNFSDFPRLLSTLNVRNNRIRSFIDWSTSLTISYIDLSNNLIEALETVNGHLQYLNLSDNRIRELNNTIFSQSIHLVTLDLSRNFMFNLDANLFAALSKLETLNLQNNNFDAVPIGCFRNLESLRTLNLSSNHIFQFEYGTFSGLLSLQALDVSGNKLMYLFESSFLPLKQLTHLNIGQNFVSSVDVHDLLDHLTVLHTVKLNDNLWNCEALVAMVKSFEKGHVLVISGTVKKTKNVLGIGCSDYKRETNGSSTSKPFEELELSNRDLIATELKALHRFLNDEFVNSNFYKFFMNLNNTTLNKNVSEVYFDSLFVKHFEDGFKNTTFYKFFQTDQFSEKFDKGFSKMSDELRAFGFDLNNSSLFGFLGSNATSNKFFDHFENRFRNSNFYKFFERDFESSNFFKGIDNKTNTSILMLRNYFDDDFQNSAFFKFFTARNFTNGSFENFLRLSDGLPERNSNESANFARYSDEKGQSKVESELISELLENVKGVKIGNAVFMSMVIILLIGIVLMLSYKHVKPNIRRRRRNSITESFSKNDSVNLANSEVELV